MRENGTATPSRRKLKLFPDDPSASISCVIDWRRLNALKALADSRGVGLGSVVRQAIEEKYGTELDRIEEQL